MIEADTVPVRVLFRSEGRWKRAFHFHVSAVAWAMVLSLKVVLGWKRSLDETTRLIGKQKKKKIDPVGVSKDRFHCTGEDGRKSQLTWCGTENEYGEFPWCAWPLASERLGIWAIGNRYVIIYTCLDLPQTEVCSGTQMEANFHRPRIPSVLDSTLKFGQYKPRSAYKDLSLHYILF